MEVIESQRATSDKEAGVEEDERVKSEKWKEALSLWSLRFFAL